MKTSTSPLLVVLSIQLSLYKTLCKIIVVLIVGLFKMVRNLLKGLFSGSTLWVAAFLVTVPLVVLCLPVIVLYAMWKVADVAARQWVKLLPLTPPPADPDVADKNQS